MNRIIAEAKELLKNARYADGQAICLTQDCEALESALAEPTTTTDLELIADRIASVRSDYDLPEDASAILAGELDALNNVIREAFNSVTISLLKSYAKELLAEEPANELGREYNRGICELISDLVRGEGSDHAEEAQKIADEFGCKI